MNKFKTRILSLITASVMATGFVGGIPIVGANAQAESSGIYSLNSPVIVQTGTLESSLSFSSGYDAVKTADAFDLSDSDQKAFDQMVEELRDKLTAHESDITVSGVFEDVPDTSLVASAYYAATEHTGNPKQGDYIRKQQDDSDTFIQWQQISDNEYNVSFIYNMNYFTTLEQEKELDKKVGEILQSLDLENDSDYQKVKKIYNYLCSNVTYDYAGLEDDSSLIEHSAYAALVNNTAVCQGYALSLYRLLLTEGIDCRYISGVSRNESHAWNIVKLNEIYYLADSTWDAGRSEDKYVYFLKCSSEFPDHSPSGEFTTAEFIEEYPLADKSYIEPIFEYELLDDGTVAITGFLNKGKPSSLNIPSQIDGKPVTQINEYAFSECAELCEVIIPDSVVSVGKFAFYKCENLKTVDIPEGVTDIGDYAFSDCTSLKNITIPDSVTEIGNFVFANCRSLNKVIISGNTKKIGMSAFSNCVSLESVTIPEGVTYIGANAFFGCISLESVTIPKSVKEIEANAFENNINDDPGRVKLTIYCYKDTAGEMYAIENNFKYEYIHTCNSDLSSVTKEPTCTEDGIKTYFCSICNKAIKTEPIPAAGHKYIDTIVSPTETEQGYTLHKCSVCGDSYKDEFTDPNMLIGDISGDNRITTVDVGIANSFAKGTRKPSDIEFLLADLNGDGKITTADVGLINRIAKGAK